MYHSHGICVIHMESEVSRFACVFVDRILKHIFFVSQA